MIRVKLSDGKAFDCEAAGAADLIAFERTYKVSAVRLQPGGSEPPLLEWIAFTTHQTLQRKGHAVPPFEEFVKLIETIEEVEEEASAPGEASGAEAPTG